LSISPEAYRLSSISVAESETLSCRLFVSREPNPHIIEPLRPLIMKKHMAIIKIGHIHHNEALKNSEPNI
jgi:hypothetical protein